MQWKNVFVSKMLSMESWIKSHFPQSDSSREAQVPSLQHSVKVWSPGVSPDVKAVPARQTQAGHMSLLNHRGSSLAQPPVACAEGFLLFSGFRRESATIRWCDKGDGSLWIGKKAQKKPFVNIYIMLLGFSLLSTWGGNRGLCLLLGLWEQLPPLHTPQLIRKWVNKSYSN